MVRGRPAWKPDPADKIRPRPEPGLVVVLQQPADRRAWSVDFATLGLPPQLAKEFASLFSRMTRRRGQWRSSVTCVGKLYMVKRLFHLLVDRDGSRPSCLAELPDDLLSLYASAYSESEASLLKSMLRNCSEAVSPGLQQRLLRRSPKPPAKTERITRQHFEQQKRLLAKELRDMERRRAPYADLFDGPESESFLSPSGSLRACMRAMVSASPGTAVSELAEYRAYVEASNASSSRPLAVSEIASLLFLRAWELDLLVLGLVTEFGFNVQSILEMRVPEAQINPVTPDRGIYGFTLEKRRRGSGVPGEPRIAPFQNGERSVDVITRILRLTANARRAAGTEEQQNTLLLYVDARAEGGILKVATRDHYDGVTVRRKFDELAPGFVPATPTSTRNYFNVIQRKGENQNSSATHHSDYVLTSEEAKRRSLPVLAAGIGEAYLRAVKGEPGVTPSDTSEDALANGCADPLDGPDTPTGSRCDATFLTCPPCKNARFSPRHIPAMTRVYANLVARASLPASMRSIEEQPALSVYTDLKRNYITNGQWEEAQNALTDDESDLVDLHFSGAIDYHGGR